MTDTSVDSPNSLRYGAMVLGLGIFFGFRAIQHQRYNTPPDDTWFTARVQEVPGVVVVKFGAEWCGPCRHMHSSLKELQKRRVGELKIVEIDVDEKPHLAQHFGVRGIPHTFLFRDGSYQTSMTGSASADKLEAWVEPYLGGD